MDIKKALNWQNKRLLSAKESKYNSFKVNEVDFKAFNSVVEYVSVVNKKRVSKNTLFAKLFVYFLNQQVRYYKTDYFEAVPTKELCRLLDMPLGNYYEAFHKELISSQINNIIDKYKKGHKPTIEDFKDRYTLEMVTTHLDLQINQALSRFE